ncbi:MAG: vitamin K epoxide reductase family protein [Patescibacteria group bacterium]
MQTSNQMSPAPSTKPNRIPQVDIIGAWLFIFIGVIGFLDAAYLTIERFRGVIPACTIVSGCEKVLISQYSHIGPLPISLLGMVYYATIIIGALLFLDFKKIHFLHLLAAYTLLGIFASAYFLYLQIFIIQALCFYCLVSAFTSTMLFFNGWYIYRKTT